MERKTLRLAGDFLRVGAIIPLLLLLFWRLFFEHASMGVQDWFLKIAFVLWPTGMQILVVPHPTGSIGHAFTITILVIENAILYAVLALLVHWIVVRVQHMHLRHSQ